MQSNGKPKTRKKPTPQTKRAASTPGGQSPRNNEGDSIADALKRVAEQIGAGSEERKAALQRSQEKPLQRNKEALQAAQVRNNAPEMSARSAHDLRFDTSWHPDVAARYTADGRCAHPQIDLLDQCRFCGVLVCSDRCREFDHAQIEQAREY
jgi:hypothetical protein